MLAAAGLKRLGKDIPENSYLGVEYELPAVGQGIIGIECRRDDQETKSIVRSINDINTEIAVNAERSYMIELEGNCKYPLAAYATVEGDFVHLSVMIGNPESRKMIKQNDKAEINNAKELGIRLAKLMKAEKIMGIET